MTRTRITWQKISNFIFRPVASDGLKSFLCGGVLLLSMICQTVHAQELLAKVVINHKQIQGTDASVFDNLQQTLEQFINERQWTALHFQKNERIPCNFNITVTKYDQSENLFSCTALILANRPVFNASYTIKRGVFLCGLTKITYFCSIFSSFKYLKHYFLCG